MNYERWELRSRGRLGEAEGYQKKDEKEEARIRGGRARRRKGKKRNDEGAGRVRGGEKGEMEKKKKKEDSPGDLRYETLIKIISSASVGCRGAYTTASRECNDLNGNNSVKDGCSRARVHRHAARTRCAPSPAFPLFPSPAFRSARTGIRSRR